MLGFFPIASAPIADEGAGVSGGAVPITVGTNDVILRAVPSDANPNDVRLYDLTTSDAAWSAIQTSAESSSTATMAQRVVLVTATSAEQSSDASGVERNSIAITTSAEQFSATLLAERISAAVTTSAEQSSATTVAERISTAITTSSEAFSDAMAAAIMPVSIAISTGTEQSSDALLSSGAPAEPELPQGKGGQFVDRYPHIPQRLTVRIASETVVVSSNAVMGVTIPARPIPRVTMGIRSQVGAPSSQAWIQERLGVTTSSSIQVGSDSTFEETISALEYDRLYADWEDESFVMQVALDLLEV